MYKDSKRTCTASVLLIKPFVRRRSRRRRRRGLLKLPLILTKLRRFGQTWLLLLNTSVNNGVRFYAF